MTQKTELALSAIQELGRDEFPVKGADLAERLDTTASYLPHVMRPLVRAGWVAADRGPTGGYRLVEALERISVLELIEAVEGAIDDGRCVFQGSPCSTADPCVLHEPWQKARNALMNELGSTTLADVEPRGKAGQ